MIADLAIDVIGSGQQIVEPIDMPELEAQMLSHLRKGDMRRAILVYHDAMVVDVTEARAVAKVLASAHGIRCRGA